MCGCVSQNSQFHHLNMSQFVLKMLIAVSLDMYTIVVLIGLWFCISILINHETRNLSLWSHFHKKRRKIQNELGKKKMQSPQTKEKITYGTSFNDIKLYKHESSYIKWVMVTIYWYFFFLKMNQEISLGQYLHQAHIRR